MLFGGIYYKHDICSLPFCLSIQFGDLGDLEICIWIYLEFWRFGYLEIWCDLWCDSVIWRCADLAFCEIVKGVLRVTLCGVLCVLCFVSYCMLCGTVCCVVLYAVWYCMLCGTVCCVVLYVVWYCCMLCGTVCCAS